MNAATLKKREWPVIRVFVSSTFTDFKHERNALHQNVFRKLELHCATRGFQFQAIDLRWGVPMEAALDHRTMQICFEELRRSQQISPQPNFLNLLGNRYGWRPLPEVISAEEFGRLLTTAIDNHNDYRRRSATDILKQWYVQDDNSRPAEAAPGCGDYLLMSRLINFNGDARDYGKFQPKPDAPTEDTPEWKNVEAALWDLVNATYEPDDLIGRFAGLNGRAADELPQIVRFQASATEQEIWRGAFCVEQAHEHVLAFIREIDGVIDHPAPAQIRPFIDVKPGGQIDTIAKDALDDLKKQLRDRLPSGNVIASGRVRLEEVQNENGELIFDISQGHLASMCQQVEAQLMPIIDRQMDEFLGPQNATVAERARRGLQQEQREHERFGEERARADLFVGREPELRRIDAYLSNQPGHPGGSSPDFRQPLVITGASGSGKTALLSRACAIARAKETSEDRQPILRLLGISPHSSDVRGLLRSLCQELRVRNPRDGDIPQDIHELNKELRDHFESATAVKPLHIFLDALDQLSDADNGRALHWLRRDPLPEHVKLVVSCLSDRAGKPGGEPLAALEARKIPETNFVRLDVLSEGEANTLLFDRWLSDAKRSVKDTQRQTIESRLKAPECRQPLYLKILFEEARLWRSFDNDKGRDLGGGVPQLLQALFDRLSASTNHGPTVEFAMGYLASARRGLTEIEILELLYRERYYANSEYGRFLDDMTRQTGHRLPDDPKRIPIAIWSRLRFDLAPYLTEHAAPGGTVLNFYHRNLLEAVRERYLSSEEQERHGHARLAEYLDAQDYWLESLEEQRRRAKALPPTPRPANVRKVDELPWQLLQAADWPKSEQLLTDLTFLEAKAEAGMVFDLASEFSAAIGGMPANRPLLRIIELLDKAVRRNVHFIDMYPFTLFQCLWNACSWRDCPSATAHYIESEPSMLDENLPVAGTLGYRLLKRWRDEKGRATPGFTWLRSLRPLPHDSSVVTLPGHEGPVKSVCFAPDGLWIVSAGGMHGNPTIRLWDSRNGQELLCLRGDALPANSVAFSPDGNQIIGGSWAPTVHLWDASTGSEICELQGHGDMVRCVAVSPNGQQIASGSADHTVRIWNPHRHEELRCLQGHSGHVTSASFSPDNRRIVSGSLDKTVRVWDAQTGAELAVFCGHEKAVYSVAYSPDGRRIVSGSEDMTVRVWDSESGHERRCLRGHDEGVTAVALSPDGLRIISGSRDATVRVWDAESGRELRRLKGHASEVTCLAVAPDGLRMVTGSADYTVRVWDLESSRRSRSLRGHGGSITNVTFSPAGNRLLTYGHDQTVRVWDTHSGQELCCIQRQTAIFSFSPDGHCILGVVPANAVQIWNAESGQELHCLRGHEAPVRTAAYSGNGILVVTGSSDRTVRIWNAETGLELSCLRGHDEYVTSVAVSLDGQYILSGSGDRTVRLWQIESGREVYCLRGHEAPVRSVAFASKGEYALSGSWDRTVRVWDAKTGIEKQCFRALRRYVTKVAFSPDGSHIVGWLSDRTARIWNLDSGQCVHVLQAEIDPVTAIAAGPNHFPYRAFSAMLETVIRAASTDLPVAVFPVGLRHIETHPNGRIWGAARHDHVYILMLEGK